MITTNTFRAIESPIPALGLALILAASQPATAQGGRGVEELDDVAAYVEWNSTDTDYGIQFFWDSEGFTSMSVMNDDGRVLDVRTNRNVRTQGLTEGFFESVEPPSDEVSMEAFFERFPEGEYRFVGRGTDGERLLGETELTHTLPAPPVNLWPAGGEIVSHLGFEASFDAVTEDTGGEAIEIELYSIVVEKIEDEPILQVFSVVLPPGGPLISVTVPAEFLEPDTEYKLEVIAQEESGNRTISESGIFRTDAP